MELQTDAADEAEVGYGPAVRAKLYRDRAAALERVMAESTLPQVRAKYRDAADRFLELAQAEESVAARRQSGAAADAPSDDVLRPLLAFLRA
jgi:hypothetical protein